VENIDIFMKQNVENIDIFMKQNVENIDIFMKQNECNTKFKNWSLSSSDIFTPP